MHLIKRVFSRLIFAAFILGLVITFVLPGCKSKSNTYVLTGNSIVDGENLAKINCAKCHAFTPPAMLTKTVWRYHTMPAMAHYLGVTAYMGGYYKKPADTGGLSFIEYADIAAYYQKLAPDTLLPAKKPTPILKDWAGFQLIMPPKAKQVSFTTLVSWSPGTGRIYSADLKTLSLTGWDPGLKANEITTLPSAAVNALFKKTLTGANEALLTCIGRIEPIDFSNGKVISADLASGPANGVKAVSIADDLNRPIQTLEQDFNRDGLKDLVILAQGNTQGGLYLYQQNKDQSYTQKLITSKAGAVQAVAGDFNNDGWPDLMVLYGTGDEGLWLLLNNKKGGFTSRNLLRFPPLYGSTSFQLTDMDHDGKPDLIYTCGYNFHDSRILKPYHGLYIFKNTGNWNFKKEWFYPVNGCTKAIAADFDGDGDLDIAVNAFFADMQHQPEEEFLYFEQSGALNFIPHSPPVSGYGRWFSMDVADYDKDGRPDIILGNYSTGFLFQNGLKPFWDKYIPFIILKNNFKITK